MRNTRTYFHIIFTLLPRRNEFNMNNSTAVAIFAGDDVLRWEELEEI